MGISFPWVAAWLFLLLGECPTSYGQTLPPAQQLTILAPHLSLQEKDVRFFEATGKFDWEQVHLKFALFAEKPDRTALRVLDSKDNTPILWASGRAFMFYDPLADELVLGKGVPFFQFRMEKAGPEAEEDDLGKEKLTLGFGISTGGKTTASGLTLGLKSFWMNVQDIPEVRPGEGGTLLLQGRTPKGGRIIAHIDPLRAAGPYKKFELFMPGAGKESFFTLNGIAVNQPLKPGWFEFPKRFLLDSGLRIRQIEPGEGPGFPLDMGRLVRAILARMAIHGGDEIKPLVEKMY